MNGKLTRKTRGYLLARPQKEFSDVGRKEMRTETMYKNPKPKNLPYSKNRQNLTKRRLGYDDQSYDDTCQPHIQKTAKI